MERTTIQVGAFEVNCSVLAEDGKAWIVDPGSEADRIIALLAEKHLSPAGILLTHAHFDHIGGIPALQAAFPDLPVFVHPDDIPVITHPLNQLPPDYPAISMPKNLQAGGGSKVEGGTMDDKFLCSTFNLQPPTCSQTSIKQSNNPTIQQFPNLPPSTCSHSSLITILPTPGHTPGGVCYYFPNDKLLFSGDTLFAGSVGRTDLPGGDMATLRQSLEKLKVLPHDTTVIPGHGMFTTIGDELDGNPFLQ